MDVFSWATPFIAEKVTEMFDAIFNKTIDSNEKVEGSKAVSNTKKKKKKMRKEKP